jgi:hypothetical protein
VEAGPSTYDIPPCLIQTTGYNPMSSGTPRGGWSVDIYYVSSKPPGSCTPPGELRKTSGDWQTADIYVIIYFVSSKPPGRFVYAPPPR